MSISAVLSILSAGLAVFLLGHLWYHAKVFGGAWMRMTNITPEMAEAGKRRSFFYSTVSLLAAFVLAGGLRYVGELAGVQGIIEAFVFAALIWIAFFVPTLLGQLLWEGKPAKLHFINAGYWLFSLATAAVLLFI